MDVKFKTLNPIIKVKGREKIENLVKFGGKAEVEKFGPLKNPSSFMLRQSMCLTFVPGEVEWDRTSGIL